MRAKTEIDWPALRERLARAEAGPDLLDDAAAERLLKLRARALARPSELASEGEQLELLCFGLAEERYAIELRYAFSVQRLEELARLPGAPEHLLGVTNLRGEILPVFDLRVLLGVGRAGLCDLSRLIVLGGDAPELGVLADAVHELCAIAASSALEPPDSIAGIGRRYLRGVTADALIVLDGNSLLEDPALFIADAGGAPDENR